MDPIQTTLVTLISKYEDMSTTPTIFIVEDLNALLIQYLKKQTEEMIQTITKQEEVKELTELEQATKDYEAKYNKSVSYRYKNSLDRIKSKL